MIGLSLTQVCVTGFEVRIASRGWKLQEHKRAPAGASPEDLVIQSR